ncbi:hypothetical protein DFH09DRAFT_1108750 [Mycena vulgaris]|nr:hypothetical protein DFH09DRAFT_1108750 [Mycena vulgaris]
MAARLRSLGRRFPLNIPGSLPLYHHWNRIGVWESRFFQAAEACDPSPKALHRRTKTSLRYLRPHRWGNGRPSRPRIPVQIQRAIELPLNCQHLKQCGAHIKYAFALFVIPKMRQIKVVHHLTQSRLWDGFELGVRDQTAAANPFVRMSASINLLLALEVGVEVLDYGMAVVECCQDFDDGVDGCIENGRKFWIFVVFETGVQVARHANFAKLH